MNRSIVPFARTSRHLLSQRLGLVYSLRHESSSTESSAKDAKNGESPESVGETDKNEEFTAKSQDSGGPKSEDDIRTEVLEAALRMVPALGFTKQAVVEGATSLGYSAATQGILDYPEVDLIKYFHQKCNKEMLESLNDLPKVTDQSRWNSKMETFLTEALEKRLSLLWPYKHHWLQAKGIMILPQNACTELESMAHVADEIWHAAGCKSTDTAWYGKRAAVGLVYHNTELYMLQDNSPDMEATRKFLRSQIQDLKWGFGMAEWVGAVATQAPQFAAGVGKTVFNMIGFR